MPAVASTDDARASNQGENIMSDVVPGNRRAGRNTTCRLTRLGQQRVDGKIVRAQDGRIPRHREVAAEYTSPFVTHEMIVVLIPLF